MHNINELEAKRIELRKATTESNQHLDDQESNADQEMEQKISSLVNELSTMPPNIANNCYQNENDISLYHDQVEPSPKAVIVDNNDFAC